MDDTDSTFCSTSADSDEIGVVLKVTDFTDHEVDDASGLSQDINIINASDFLQSVVTVSSAAPTITRYVKSNSDLEQQSQQSADGSTEVALPEEGVLDVLVSTANQAVIPVSVEAYAAYNPASALIDAADDVIVTADMSTNGSASSGSNWITSRTDKRTIHEQGHTWRQGQWSNEENEILRNNITAYCKERGISDPNSIIFDMTKDMRKDFYRLIARGLDRPLFSVYRRVIRMYDQKNHIGKYTPQEIARLRELREIHGNDWARIGSELGRSAGSVRDRCRLMKDSCRYGTWKPDEEVRLANAVYALSGTQPGQEVHHGLCWADVALRVKTRTEKQCRAKWLNVLNWKQIGGTEWSPIVDDAILIDKIIATGAMSESQVDWTALAKGWSCVRSPQWLRSKWWALKRQVHGYHTLPFPKLLSEVKHYSSNPSQPRQLSRLTPKSPRLPSFGSVSASSAADEKRTSANATLFTHSSDGSGVAVEDEDEGSSESSIIIGVGETSSSSGSAAGSSRFIPLHLLCDNTGSSSSVVQLPDGTHAVLSDDFCLDPGSLQFISPIAASSSMSVDTSTGPLTSASNTASASSVGSLLLTNSVTGGVSSNSSSDALLFPLSGGIAAEQQLIVHALPIVSTDPELGDQVYTCHVEERNDTESLNSSADASQSSDTVTSDPCPIVDQRVLKSESRVHNTDTITSTSSDTVISADPALSSHPSDVNSQGASTSTGDLLLGSHFSSLPDPLLTDH